MYVWPLYNTKPCVTWLAEGGPRSSSGLMKLATVNMGQRIDSVNTLCC